MASRFDHQRGRFDLFVFDYQFDLSSAGGGCFGGGLPFGLLSDLVVLPCVFLNWPLGRYPRETGSWVAGRE